MAEINMAEMEFIQLLPKMIGETITTYCDPPDSAHYPPRDWIVIDKLSEVSKPITESDFAGGMGSAFTAGKYLCRPSAGNEDKLAFMRIYKQIPLYGTRLDNVKVREAQASKPRNHVELDALKDLTKNKCTAAPKLLGYRFDKQDANDLVPGGYIMYLVWEKVPGEPLDINEFWSLPFSQRQIFRDKFKKAYTEVLRFGYMPIMSTPSKIILDKTTGDMYALFKVSGFSWAARIRPEDKEWKDYNFMMFSLVLIDQDREKDFPTIVNDLKDVLNNGWRW
ncbi:hypothetical protein ACN42_g3295 [Penicillium freii]|uniref:Protein kinase domain-containing protein n=1 Tax=Penicillium freii TaxID=48697 RepID=A0A117NQC4_PENFR|nr:hypothetical protein ACN42_g3295 [Penicillium freii]